MRPIYIIRSWFRATALDGGYAAGDLLSNIKGERIVRYSDSVNNLINLDVVEFLSFPLLRRHQGEAQPSIRAV